MRQYLETDLAGTNLGEDLLELTGIHVIGHVAYEQTHRYAFVNVIINYYAYSIYIRSKSGPW